MIRYFLKIYDRLVGKQQLGIDDDVHPYETKVKGYDEYKIEEGKITFRFFDKDVRDRNADLIYKEHPGVAIISYQGRENEWQ